MTPRTPQSAPPTLQPWQRELFERAVAISPDGKMQARRLVLLMPRRNPLRRFALALALALALAERLRAKP